MNKTKTICTLGIGIALYVALSAVLKIPLISHIQSDLGYIVFGAYCVMFGRKGTVVGVVGCLIESLIFSGWIPFGWILGQIAIGLICGYVYHQDISTGIKVLATVLAVAIGIVGIKTAVECSLYNIPVAVKIPKNAIAALSDTITMIIGFFVGRKLSGKYGMREKQ